MKESTVVEKAQAIAIITESLAGPSIALILVVGAFFAPGLPPESRSNLLNTLAGFVAGITFPGAVSQLSRKAGKGENEVMETEVN